MRVKLSTLAEFRNGLNFSKENVGKGCKIIGVSDFGNRTTPDYSDLQEVHNNIVRQESLLEDGDIIFVRSNGNKELVGRSMIIKNIVERVTFAGFCIRLRILNTELCLQDYLAMYFRAPMFRLALSNSANGANIQNLSQEILGRLEITLPSIKTQRRIADILSAYDDLIENNQKQIKLLEEAAMRLYKEWFIKLRFPGHESVKVVDGVPEGWDKGVIKDFGEVITGKTPSTAIPENYGGSIPFIKIPDMHGVIFPLKTEITLSLKGANTQKNKFLPPMSIIVSCIATVGLVCITSEQCQTNQQINSIVLKNQDNLYYVYFRMTNIKLLLEGVGSNGATMTNVNKTKFENIPILIPDKDIIVEFNKKVEYIFDSIYILSKQIERLKEARDRLLPKLMSGEIEV